MLLTNYLPQADILIKLRDQSWGEGRGWGDCRGSHGFLGEWGDQSSLIEFKERLWKIACQ